MNIKFLFVGLADRKMLLLHYSVPVKHFALQIRVRAKNLEIIKMTILERQINSRVLFVGLKALRFLILLFEYHTGS